MFESTPVRNDRCELVSGMDVSFLTGKVKTLIDSFGFDEVRANAAKDVANTILWDWFNYIYDHKTDHLEAKKEWYAQYRLDFDKPAVGESK